MYKFLLTEQSVVCLFERSKVIPVATNCSKRCSTSATTYSRLCVANFYDSNYSTDQKVCVANVYDSNYISTSTCC